MTAPTDFDLISNNQMKTLNDVQIGDVLIISRRMGRRVVEVEYITAARFRTKGGDTWHKKNGKLVGSCHDKWFTETIRFPEDNEIEEIQLTKEYAQTLRSIENLSHNLMKVKPTQELLLELKQVKTRLNAIMQPNT